MLSSAAVKIRPDTLRFKNSADIQTFVIRTAPFTHAGKTDAEPAVPLKGLFQKGDELVHRAVIVPIEINTYPNKKISRALLQGFKIFKDSVETAFSVTSRAIGVVVFAQAIHRYLELPDLPGNQFPGYFRI